LQAQLTFTKLDKKVNSHDVVNTCHRSSASWNSLLEYDTPFAREGFVACAGAKSYNIASKQVLGEPKPKAQFDNQAIQVATLRSAPHPPSMVSLSVGGNDIGFYDVVADCLVQGVAPTSVVKAIQTLDPLFFPPAEKVHNTIQQQCLAQIALSRSEEDSDLPSDLNTDMKNIHAAAPDAAIFVMGYPDVVNTNQKQALNNCSWLTGPVQEHLVDLISHLNVVESRTISNMPASMNVHYVTTYGALDGNNLCTKHSYINTWKDAFADGYSGTVSAWYHEIAHPDFEGQQVLNAIVAKAINSWVAQEG
jgi:hypothetical protein